LNAREWLAQLRDHIVTTDHMDLMTADSPPPGPTSFGITCRVPGCGHSFHILQDMLRRDNTALGTVTLKLLVDDPDKQAFIRHLIKTTRKHRPSRTIVRTTSWERLLKLDD
jgi:hypothetical protein